MLALSSAALLLLMLFAAPAGASEPSPLPTCESGTRHLELTADRVVGRVVVRDELLGHDGAVHGGVYAAMSESVSSVGTYLGVRDDGMAAMGMSNATTVVGRVTGGVVEATGVPSHVGEREWLWNVEIRDGAGKLCAMSSMAIAVRPAP